MKFLGQGIQNFEPEQDRARVWERPHGERGVRANNGGMGHSPSGVEGQSCDCDQGSVWPMVRG